MGPDRPGDQVNYKEWLQHVLSFQDRRFVEDPLFPLVAHNIYMRHRCLSLGSVVARDEEIGQMTVEELKAEVDKDNSGVLAKLRYYSQNLDGSPQYFYQQSLNMVHFMEHLRLRSKDKESMVLFTTFSPADFHWPQLHKLLHGSERYLGKKVHTFLLFYTLHFATICFSYFSRWLPKNLRFLLVPTEMSTSPKPKTTSFEPRP